MGQIDYLNTKSFNNIDVNDSIKFDWAYAPRTGFTDRMQVKVSTNGGTTFPFTIFDKSGSLLGTAPHRQRLSRRLRHHNGILIKQGLQIFWFL